MNELTSFKYGDYKRFVWYFFSFKSWPKLGGRMRQINLTLLRSESFKFNDLLWFLCIVVIKIVIAFQAASFGKKNTLVQFLLLVKFLAALKTFWFRQNKVGFRAKTFQVPQMRGIFFPLEIVTCDAKLWCRDVTFL